MRQERFDNLTKIVASSTSRREVLRKLGVGIAGALFASLLPTQALAEPKPKTIKCKIKEQVNVDGNKLSAYCEVECTGEAGYCVVCGNKEKDKDNSSVSCAAACCAADDLTTCTPPNKKDIQAQCQQGRVRVVKG